MCCIGGLSSNCTHAESEVYVIICRKSTTCANFRDDGESVVKELKKKKLVDNESRTKSATVLHQGIGTISLDMTMYPFP